MDRSLLGQIAEKKVALKMIELGYDVLWPDGVKAYDFVVFKDNCFKRVQVKKAQNRKGIATFNAYSSGGQSYKGTADLYGVYYPDTESVFLVPIDRVTRNYGGIHVVTPKRRHQNQLYASHYELKAA